MRRLLSVAVVLIATIAIGSSVSPQSVGAVPAGFTDTTVPSPPSNPLSSPTAIVSLPGARGLVLEKAGGVRVLLPDGTLAPVDALSLSVCTGSEMGLLGAAVDPGFIVN